MTCSNCVDTYNWLAVYDDGQRINECDGSGHHLVYADIDHARVTILAWVDGTGRVRASVMNPAGGESLVFFRRRRREVNMSGIEVGPLPTIHGLGKEPVDGTGHYVFLFDDGTTRMSNDRNAV